VQLHVILAQLAASPAQLVPQAALRVVQVQQMCLKQLVAVFHALKVILPLQQA